MYNCRIRGNSLSTKEVLKKWILRLSVVLLPLSTGFTVVAVTLLMLGDLEMIPFTFSVLVLVSGAILFYAAVLLRNHALFFFAATFLLLTGILLVCIDIDVLFVPLRLIWPLLMLFIAFSFMVAGFFRYRRLHAMYVAPSVAFTVLGFLFLLFSTKVINASLTAIALWWFPLFFAAFLISVTIWLFRNKLTSRDADD